MSGCEYRLSSKMRCGREAESFEDGVEPNGGRRYCAEHQRAVMRNRAALARRNEAAPAKREERSIAHADASVSAAHAPALVQ